MTDRDKDNTMMARAGLIAGALCFLLLMGLALCAGSSDASESAVVQAQREAAIRAILMAEDARPTSDAGMKVLLDGLVSSDAEIQSAAVRALGRLERPALLQRIVPLLRSPSPQVRGEAGNAVAQASMGIATLDTAVRTTVLRDMFTALRDAAAAENDVVTRTILARSLARLPYRTAAEVKPAEELIAAAAVAANDSTSAIHAMLAIEELVRVHGRRSPLDVRTTDAAAAIAARASAPSYARRLAFAVLLSTRRVDVVSARAALANGDEWLRRAAALALADADTAGRSALAASLINDRHPALRRIAITMLAPMRATDCSVFLAVAQDSVPRLAFAALDMLRPAGTNAQPAFQCPEAQRSTARQVVRTLAAALPASQAVLNTAKGRAAAHVAARALTVLSRTSPALVDTLLPGFVSHPMWQVRMNAATLLARFGRSEDLLTLTRDSDANVRAAALTAYATRAGRAADSAFVAALTARHYGLLLTAAQGLRGTTDRERAKPALLSAFLRVTAERRETSRDARVAILSRISEMATSADAAALRAHVNDIDPVVRDSVRSIISRVTGEQIASGPVTLNRVDEPASPVTVARQRIRFTMAAAAGGGTFEVELFAREAPFTVSRFMRLVRSGYYNGLTFHRVVQDFVAQGGSPGANEYVGDGPFMRDEISLQSHERGSLGVSTRGRDTGDAQIFINLIDNQRLDYDYTVFARVSAGMDIVDGLLEGDVIQRVEIVQR